MKRSTSPSRSQSPQATPCPFWRWPVPDEPVISANRAPADVLEHAVGDQGGEARVAGAQVEVEEAVVVEVAEVAPHGGEDQVQPGFLGPVLEASAGLIAEQPVGISGVRLTDQALDHVVERTVVAGGEEVEPAVVVVVPGPARETLVRPVDPHRARDVGEGAVAVVAEQAGVPGQIVEEQVGITVVVVVDPGGALAESPVLLVARRPWRRPPRTCRLPGCDTGGWAGARSR